MQTKQHDAEGTVHTTLNRFLNEAIEDWRARKQPSSFDYTNVVNCDERIISDLALRQVIFNVLDNAFEASPNWIGVAAGKKMVNWSSPSAMAAPVSVRISSTTSASPIAPRNRELVPALVSFWSSMSSGNSAGPLLPRTPMRAAPVSR
nr:hypothetical protein [Rhizobium subbaraonis]